MINGLGFFFKQNQNQNLYSTFVMVTLKKQPKLEKESDTDTHSTVSTTILESLDDDEIQYWLQTQNDIHDADALLRHCQTLSSALPDGNNTHLCNIKGQIKYIVQNIEGDYFDKSCIDSVFSSIRNALDELHVIHLASLGYETD